MTRVELARFFTELCSVAVEWDMYWFANRYLDMADILASPRPIAEVELVKLEQMALNQQEAYMLLAQSAAQYGEQVTRAKAIQIDRENEAVAEGANAPRQMAQCNTQQRALDAAADYKVNARGGVA